MVENPLFEQEAEPQQEEEEEALLNGQPFLVIDSGNSVARVDPGQPGQSGSCHAQPAQPLLIKQEILGIQQAKVCYSEAGAKVEV